jgi:hypothetical protein
LVIGISTRHERVRGEHAFELPTARPEYAPRVTPTYADPQQGALIPARVDRPRWSPFHTRMVLALGVAWILDGLEITSDVADILAKGNTLHVSARAWATSPRSVSWGGVVSALFSGRLSDRLGRIVRHIGT